MEHNNNYCVNKKKSLQKGYFNRGGCAIYVLPVVASIFSYVNSLSGDFVHDDLLAIVENGDVTGKQSILSLFTHDFWGKSMVDFSSHKSYRPLCILSFRLNHFLSGSSPVSYHVVNVLLHSAVTGLLAHVCLSVLRLSAIGSLLAGLMFAVHPIHTEAVSGLVGRADVLAGFFFLLSFLTYTWSSERQYMCGDWRQKMFLISLCLGVCAMLSKETGVTVLGVNLLYDITVTSQLQVRRIMQDRKYIKQCPELVKRVLCSSILIIFCILFRLWVMGGELPTFTEQDNPAAFAPSILTRFLTYNYLVYFNINLLLAPIRLSYDWQIGSVPLVVGVADTRNLLTLSMYGVLVLLLFTALLKLKSDRCNFNPALAGLLFLCLPYIPASNLFFRVGFVVAERLLYIPSMGSCILVAYGFTLLTRRLPRLQWLITSLFLFTLSTMALKTVERNTVWQTRESLFRSGLESVPLNAKVHYNYANYLKDKGFTETAIQYSRRAIELYPKYSAAWNNLGTLLTDQVEEERCYREALQHQPDHVPAYINLGSLLFQHGNTDEGLSLLRKAESIDPHDSQVCIMLGSMLGHQGETTEAGRYFRKAIQEKPDFADAYNNYGAYLQQTGHYTEAVENYRHAVALDAGHVDAMTNAAQSLRHLGRLSEAETFLKQALELQQSAVTLDQLGKFYLTTGHPRKALAVYRRLEDKLINSSDVTGLRNYATVLVETNHLEEAETVLQRVLQADPDDVLVLHQMSSVLGLLQHHSQGLVFIDRAVRVATLQGDKSMLGKLHFARASHLKDTKQYEEALLAYLDSLSINNHQPKVHVNVGAIYHMKHNIKLAKHHYSETLRLDPANRIARDNLDKLEKLANKKRVPKPT